MLWTAFSKRKTRYNFRSLSNSSKLDLKASDLNVKCREDKPKIEIMLTVQVQMGGQSKRNVTYQSSKEVNSRPCLSRERSFVRPKSSASQVQDVWFPEGQEIRRQRSFAETKLSLQQSRDQHQKRKNTMPASHRYKPALEIYRPPTLRGPGNSENGTGDSPACGKTSPSVNGTVSCSTSQSSSAGNAGVASSPLKPGLNINAKEFVSLRVHLQHSKSSNNIPQQETDAGDDHCRKGSTVNGEPAVAAEKALVPSSPPRVHFSNDIKGNDPAPQAGMMHRPASLPVEPHPTPVKRSKSLGSGDLRLPKASGSSSSPLSELEPLPQEAQNMIRKALTDLGTVSGRQLMEIVKHIFSRVTDSFKLAEPAARLCISIIEKEKNETFLETLLNTCQEYFQERDRLLRHAQSSSYAGFVPRYPKWIAYMTFLREMYTQLKRHHVQLMSQKLRNSDIAPGLLLLNLLAQCCLVCLKETAVNSLSEMECLFFVLTAVGKDMEVELPQQMARVIGAARDAFMTTVKAPALKKTLLQLIEMNAARWQLSAPAIMYYYPSSGGK